MITSTLGEKQVLQQQCEAGLDDTGRSAFQRDQRAIDIVRRAVPAAFVAPHYSAAQRPMLFV